ncbi:DNA internalization-related competence protein ComEC/Rec2 [Peptoniphilus sp. MSJ-1]|uniref:DNA internalization-related competence protein ComEC/Rec2 n=1 Tax=Peptoniphilus ovalis TaxID=2841503 RepID=A0ABS6FK89_9FIRM|nr:DNA internalization-related competence protein ComEC/Rec2 [Peptoniphilus ovalis]MBU5669932.1 DNA internalization-related competence protein ComEC/Rec2 [Peptoniphilus ovalis]
MYILFAVLLGIFLSAITKSFAFLIIFSAGLSIYLIKTNKKAYYLILPLIIISVFINFKSKDYVLNAFNGEVIGKVLYSNDEKSIIKTNSIKGEKFKTRIIIYENLERGATYKIKGKFTPPPPAMNEGNFNSRNNLKSQGIYLYGKINSLEKIKDSSALDKFSTYFIKRTQNIFHKYLSERNANLLESLILANRYKIDDLESERFANLGISHLLAVSGLHIGIIVAFLHFIFIKTTKNLKITDAIVVILIIFYLKLIGNPISAVRAFLFYLLYKLSFYFKVDLDNKDVFYLSLSIILFINPMAIYSLSFLMSYAAIFGMIFIMPIIYSFVADKGRVMDSIVLTFSVILVIFPIINYYFSGVSILVYPANLIIIPFYTFVIISGFIMSLGIFPGIIGMILNVLMNSIYGLEEILLRFNIFNFEIRGFKLEYVFLYYIILVLILNRHKIYEIIEPNIKIIEIYIVIIFAIYSIGFIKESNSLIYRQFYIGQGDAAMISHRGRNFLIDVGGARYDNTIFERYLEPSLDYLGVYKIDGIFISHYDEDHVGNLEKVLKNYKVKNVYVGHLPEDNFFEDVNPNGFISLSRNDRLKIDKDFYIDVLNIGDKNVEENDKSLVLDVYYRGKKILFTGDLSKNYERNINEDVDILKVSHHGSNTSTDEKFLENITPKYAVISAGVGNSYGHPHREVLESLEKYGIIYFDTSKVGEIIFKIDKNIEVFYFLKNRETNLIYILMSSLILYYIARKNYELQGNLQR